MTILRRLLLAAGLLLGSFGYAAAPLPAADQDFLRRYEEVRAALTADDLSAAQTAAREWPEAKEIAEAAGLSAARKAFKALSARAVAIARGQPGYVIVHCSMFPGGADWVQTGPEIANPYWGKSMLRCGEIVK